MPTTFVSFSPISAAYLTLFVSNTNVPPCPQETPQPRGQDHLALRRLLRQQFNGWAVGQALYRTRLVWLVCVVDARAAHRGASHGGGYRSQCGRFHTGHPRATGKDKRQIRGLYRRDHDARRSTSALRRSDGQKRSIFAGGRG